MSRRWPAAIAVALSLATQAGAHAGGWQYCLAFARADHRVYVTGALKEAPDAEGAFTESAAEAGLRFDDAQCPRADDHATLIEMLDYAIRYNRRIGLTVIELPKDGFVQAKR